MKQEAGCERPRTCCARLNAPRSIAAEPRAGLLAPRPYPELRRAGRRWIIEGRYWIAYSLSSPPVISAVFYDTADIPGRL